MSGLCKSVINLKNVSQLRIVSHFRGLHLSPCNLNETNKSIEKKPADNQVKEQHNFWDLYEKTYGKNKRSGDFSSLKMRDISNLVLLAGFGVVYYLFTLNSEKKKAIEEKYEWLKFPFFKYKLFVCNGFCLPEYLAKDLESYKTFQVRTDDVWIVSFPKSGTTWLQEVAFLIQNNCDFSKAKSDSIETRSPFLDYPSPGIKFIDKMKSPRVIKTHLPIEFLPDNVENQSKVQE
jgi:hypothetical protein